jgi:multiple sugar transport system ATP-binding protein
MSTLELKDLSKVHPDGTEAVAGIDLALEDGEFFVLVGPSGCGKTTVLRMVAGLEPVTTGEVLVDGVRVNETPANARDVAMVFQDNVLYPHLTVGENIGFALRIAKVGKRQIRNRVAETARLLQLTDLLDRYPGQLSGGQQQRAAMGRAIVRTPRILLMDEPMSNLDAKLRTETRFEIIALHQLVRVTTLYVTHDQVEAMAMGDRAAVMRDGRIVQCGTPLDLYERPVDLFVAQFIGMPPMNVVAATVIAHDGAPAVRIGSHTVALGDEGLHALPGVEQLIGRRVALGFRPESVRRDPDGPLVVSPTWAEPRGVDQLVTARIDGSRVTETGDGIVVSDDHSSLINVSMPLRDVIDIWKPLPLSIDTASIHLFDLATGAALCRPDRPARSRVSTTYRASTPSCGR